MFFKNKQKLIRKENTISHTEAKGFTLLEVIFAIFILLTAITGPLAFGQSGLRAAFLARDQVGAFALAQDAMETVKNIRDNNILNPAGGTGFTGWLNGLGTCNSQYGCNIDTASSFPTIKIAECKASCSKLLFDSKNKKFGNSSASSSSLTESEYKRTVFVREIKKDREAQVVVVVEWNTGPGILMRKVIVQENIFNWAGN